MSNEFMYAMLLVHLWICGTWLAPDGKKLPFVFMLVYSLGLTVYVGVSGRANIPALP